MTQDQQDGTAEEQVCSFPEFLVSTPPNTWRALIDFAQPSVRYAYKVLDQTYLEMFCDHDACKGQRYFAAETETTVEGGKAKYHFLRYTCRNCGSYSKVFSIWIKPSKDLASARVMKFGESPEFGPPTPARVISLVGPDRDLYLKGRRAENHGLGIGAFGYYRRVVENQKNRILKEIIKVAKKVDAKEEIVADLEAAVKETQFSKAVERMKHGIPDALRIDGHNPMSLLHKALSEGLHAQSDEQCLELATSIRLVLTEFSERVAQALRDDAELASAVSRLLGVNGDKGSSRA